MPQDDPHQLIKSILEAIEFRDDNDKYADEFTENIEFQAILDLLQTLSPAKQVEVKGKLAGKSQPQEIIAILHSYLSQEQIRQSIRTVAQDRIVDYLRTIKDLLTPGQIERLKRIGEKSTPLPS